MANMISKLRVMDALSECDNMIYCDAHDVMMDVTKDIYDASILHSEAMFPENKAASRRKATIRHNQKIAKRNSSICDLVNPSKRMSRIDYDNANRKRCRELMLFDKRKAKETNALSDYQKLFNNFHREIAEQY